MALLLAVVIGVLWSPPAHAFRKIFFEPGHFFDLTRAQGYWRDLKAAGQFDAAYAACKAGPYGAWEKRLEAWWPSMKDKNPKGLALEKDLEANPDRDVIKACYDLRQSWYVFASLHKGWVDRRRPWALTSDANCQPNYMHELMKVSCQDIPDWRTEKQRAFDDAQIAKYGYSTKKK